MYPGSGSGCSAGRRTRTGGGGVAARAGGGGDEGHYEMKGRHRHWEVGMELQSVLSPLANYVHATYLTGVSGSCSGRARRAAAAAAIPPATQWWPPF